MTSKKKLLDEMGVFLLITFSIMMIFWWKAYPDGELTDEMTGLNNFFYYLTAFSPAIGCIITRYAFGHGFKDDILFPKFTGHFKGYLLSIILPLLFGVSTCILMTVALGAGFTVKAEGGALEVLAALSFYSMQAYVAFFILIGEELGWRGFLYDSLERLFGLNGSIVVGGIIWGLWHIPPLIGMGLNYGKDAPGFPATNIILMCVSCIFTGAMLQMLYKMTGSVVAPIIAHAVIDTVCNPLAIMFLSEELVAGKQFQMGICLTASAMLLGIPCWIYMNWNGGKSRDESSQLII